MIQSRSRAHPAFVTIAFLTVFLGLEWAAGLSDLRADEPFRGLVYAERGEGDEAIRLVCDVHLPAGEGPFPAVLCVHGGAWRLGSKEHMRHVVRLLTARGYAAVPINYRLAPKHPFPAQQQDCHAALCWLHANATRYKIDPTRIGALGYSAGAQMVVLEALTGTRAERPAWADDVGDWSPVRLGAAIAGGTPCDFRGLPLDTRAMAYWLGGTRREFPQRYAAASPAAFASADAPPIYFFHDEQDVMVPRAGMTDLAESLRKAGAVAEVDVVLEHGHITTFFNEDAYTRAIDFLDRHLRADEQACISDLKRRPR